MKITQHAKERYAERIRGKEELGDIKSYIANNEEKIDRDLNTMLEHAELIYIGRSISEYNKNVVEVHLCHDWVLIVDPAKQNIVTVYKIDLNVGQQFNNEYIKRALEMLNTAKKELENEKIDCLSQEEAYTNIIQENNNVIAEYKRMIKALEEQNESYQAMANSLATNIELKEVQVRKIVAGLVGRRVF